MDADAEALLRKEFKKVFTPSVINFAKIKPELFEDDVEYELYETIRDILVTKDEEERVSKVFASLKLVTKFLDTVTVKIEHDGIRNNRIGMIHIIKSELDNIADFKQIKGY